MDPRTPLASGKSDTPSISINMSNLQSASSTKNTANGIPGTPKVENTKSSATTTPAASPNSSNDTPKSQLQLLFPSKENRAVYHVLNTIGFKGHWVRYLMQDQKLDNYKSLTTITMDDWQRYIDNQPDYEYKPLINLSDFDRIIIFQQWCQLNSHSDDASLAFKYSREDYDKSWDEQFQLSASPTDPDLPPKTPPSTPTITPKVLNDPKFQLVTPSKSSKKHKSDDSDTRSEASYETD